MYYIDEANIDTFFSEVAKTQALYIPVDDVKEEEKAGAPQSKASNTKGANFQKWVQGAKLTKLLKTTRSAKDFFFPKTENLVNYKVEGATITVEDPRRDIEDFVIFGVRACDAKSFSIIDAVYLKMDPVDSYYKARREHGTVITLMCNDPERTCFCSSYGLDLTNGDGDVGAWLCNGKYYFEGKTDKGQALLEKTKGVLSETCDLGELEKGKADAKAKMGSQPLSHLDLTKLGNVSSARMMEIFDSKVWEGVSETCLGCGTCTYVCPTCMCFDVRDFCTKCGVQQVRCWDSCMYSDFTQMAAANPRLTQKERSRQRFMHKLVYYPMAHEGVFSCVGCGRCLEKCPINMNIAKVIKALNEELDAKSKEGGQ